MGPHARVVIAIAMLIGCTPHTGVREGRTGESAVRTAAAHWAGAFAAHDLDEIVAGFAEDVVALYPRSAPVVGRAANRAVWAGFFTLPNAAHPLTIDTVAVARSGDMAFVRGRYLVKYDSASTPVVLGGQYATVWRPDGAGIWRIVNLTANMYTPPPRLAPGR